MREFDPNIRIIVHPPIDHQFRAYLEGDAKDVMRPYLIRNQVIVEATDVLIAMPNGEEKLRSGTWSTIRYAKRAGKKVYILMPDGTIV